MKKGMVEWQKFLDYSDHYIIRCFEKKRLEANDLAKEDKIYLSKRKLNITERLEKIDECDILARYTCPHYLKMRVVYPKGQEYCIRYVCLGCGKDAYNGRAMKSSGMIDLFHVFGKKAYLKTSDQELEWIIKMNAILHRLIENKEIDYLDEIDIAAKILEELTKEKEQPLKRTRRKGD